MFFSFQNGVKFSQACFKLFHVFNEFSVESFSIVDPEVLEKKILWTEPSKPMCFGFGKS